MQLVRRKRAVAAQKHPLKAVPRGAGDDVLRRVKVRRVKLRREGLKSMGKRTYFWSVPYFRTLSQPLIVPSSDRQVVLRSLVRRFTVGVY